MEILLVLIPISVMLGALGLGAFLWALRSGQFSDLEGDAARILLDDRPLTPEKEERPDGKDRGDGRGAPE